MCVFAGIRREMKKYHFSHLHPLKLLEKITDDDQISFRCCDRTDYSSTDQAYACNECKFFLHDSCSKLPQRIDHPLHPHSLTLTFPTLLPSSHEYNCAGCGEQVNGFLYACYEPCIDFCLDVKCTNLKPTVKFEGHAHPLTLFKNKKGMPFPCFHCLRRFVDEPTFFRCIDCNYSRHLLCGPLPRTIKDNCHMDPLKLMDDYVEYYNDTDEVYCDTCEQIRDPDECVYACTDCNFITEVKCVMTEVVHSLEGRRGNVKLRTANRYRIWINGRVISDFSADHTETEDTTEFKDIMAKYVEVKLDVSYVGLDFFTSKETELVAEIFQAAGVLVPPSDNVRKNKWSSVKDLINFINYDGLFELGDASVVGSFSDNALTNLFEQLDSFYNEEDFLDMFDTQEEIVGIGEFMIMQRRASYLKGFLHEYGDFTNKSNLSPRLKMFFLNLLFSVVREMCIFNARGVDNKRLRRWWKILKLVKHAGFEIDFAIDRLSNVIKAFFAMNVKTLGMKMKSQCDKVFEELKELEGRVDAKKRELEELDSKLKLHTETTEYPKSLVMKECFQHEAELKWKRVWEGSPLMFHLIENKCL